MIWEKIKDHFFDDFRDEITMDLPVTYTPLIKVQRILKGNTVMISKESLFKKVQTLSTSRLILTMLFVLAALFTIFYSNEEGSITTIPQTEEAIIASADAANTTVISSNLPVETITSIEKIKTESGNNTEKIIQHNITSKSKIDSLVDEHVVQTSKPLVITINSKDKKEIAVLYNYETVVPNTISPSVLPSVTTPLTAAVTPVVATAPTDTSVKTDTKVETPPVKAEDVAKEQEGTTKVVTVTNTIVKEKENLKVSKEKIKLLKDISNVLDNEMEALAILDTFKEEQVQ